MKRLLLVTLTLGLVACGGHTPAPVVTPSAQQAKVDKAVQAFRDGAAAVHVGEQAFFQAASNPHLSAADQAQIDAAFQRLDAGIASAVQTYDAAVSADSQRALVAAIGAGVNDFVRTIGAFSAAQQQHVADSVQAAQLILDLAIGA